MAGVLVILSSQLCCLMERLKSIYIGNGFGFLFANRIIFYPQFLQICVLIFIYGSASMPKCDYLYSTAHVCLGLSIAENHSSSRFLNIIF